jgi:hypothetical protein
VTLCVASELSKRRGAALSISVGRTWPAEAPGVEGATGRRGDGATGRRGEGATRRREYVAVSSYARLVTHSLKLTTGLSGRAGVLRKSGGWGRGSERAKGAHRRGWVEYESANRGPDRCRGNRPPYPAVATSQDYHSSEIEKLATDGEGGARG